MFAFMVLAEMRVLAEVRRWLRTMFLGEVDAVSISVSVAKGLMFWVKNSPVEITRSS